MELAITRNTIERKHEILQMNIGKISDKKIENIQIENSLTISQGKIIDDLSYILGKMGKDLKSANEVKSVVVDTIDIFYKRNDMKKFSQSVKDMNLIIDNSMSNKDFKKFIVEIKKEKSPGQEDKHSFTTKVDEKRLNLREKELEEIIIGSQDPKEKNLAELELENIYMYKAAKLLIKVNNEQIILAGINGGLKVANIAGNVAILLRINNKTIAIVRDVTSKSGIAMTALDTVVKTGRNKADSPNSPEWLKKVFDAEESTQKRLEKRERCSDFVLKSYENLPDTNKELSLEERRSIKMVENMIVATGCDLTNFKNRNGKHFEQRRVLLDSLKKTM